MVAVIMGIPQVLNNNSLKRIQRIEGNIDDSLPTYQGLLTKDNFPITLPFCFLSKSDRDAVTWLNAYNASTHHVYFGANQAAVAEATPTSPEYKRKINSDGNVYYLSRSLEPGSTYYWRVDAEIDHETNYKGDVWSFHPSTTEKTKTLCFERYIDVPYVV